METVCLFNILQKLMKNKFYSCTFFWPIVMRIHQSSVTFPQNGPVMQKVFSCHDVVMTEVIRNQRIHYCSKPPVVVYWTISPFRTFHPGIKTQSGIQTFFLQIIVAISNTSRLVYTMKWWIRSVMWHQAIYSPGGNIFCHKTSLKLEIVTSWELSNHM